MPTGSFERQASDGFYAKLIEGIDGILWEFDPCTSQMTFMSKAAERLLGYPLSDWYLPDFWIDHVHPEDRGWVEEYCRTESEAGRSHDFEYRFVAAGGREVWLRDLVTVKYVGDRLSLRGVMIDITEAKRMEQQRKEYVRLLECMERVSNAVQEANTTEKLVREVLDIVLKDFGCDRAWLVFPCDPNEVSWRVVAEQFRPEYPGAFVEGGDYPIDGEVAKIMGQLMASDEPIVFQKEGEMSIPESSRESFRIRSQMCLALKPKLGGTYMFGIHECSRERQWSLNDRLLFKQIGKRLEDALTAMHMHVRLRESEAVFRAFFDQAVDAMYLHAEDGRILDVNRQACDSLGYSKEEMVGRGAELFDPMLDRHKVVTMTELLMRGIPLHFDTQHRRKDGTQFPVEVWAKAFSVGDATRVVSVARDLTERERLEEQFRQAQKMEAIGRLAGGMAHDFNNLLTVIGGYCEMVLAGEKLSERNELCFQEVRKACDRASALTQQLLGFSRRKVMQPEVLDVDHRLSELRTLLERMVGEGVELVFVLEAKEAFTRTDPGQFEQAIVNLVVNAQDAIRGGGKIEIRTRNCPALPTACRVEEVLSQAPTFIEILVSDNGIGMEESVRSRVFEPFFTTKGPGKGTGLGLAMVYGFVKQSDGHIMVESQAGVGTCMRLFLPVACPTEKTKPIDFRMMPQTKGSETILLVEDEQAVRELVAMTLRNYGYEVLVAADGIEGVEVARAHPGEIHLLLSDLIMPRMNGWQLAEALRSERPKVRILFISGYSDHDVNALLSQSADFEYCSKPFTPGILLSKIRTSLSGSL